MNRTKWFGGSWEGMVGVGKSLCKDGEAGRHREHGGDTGLQSP